MGQSKRGTQLERRRKALELAASRVADQRREAEAAEAERLRREAELDDLAADFELARQDEDAVAAEVEAEVHRVRERGQERIRQARLVGARVVVAMGGKGETVAGCARRLGVGVDRIKELRRLGREDADGGPGEGDEPGAVVSGARERQASAREVGSAAEGARERVPVAASGGPGAAG
ncbi:hypothetical protein ABZ468_28395 [Streptomyces sp. NPDC005708]|uniref:hypothetical protein n=1 Tax=Streptomyces sp. NPDC005708 TaxID=3154564 RepID=UPI0033C4E4E8